MPFEMQGLLVYNSNQTGNAEKIVGKREETVQFTFQLLLFGESYRRPKYLCWDTSGVMVLKDGRPVLSRTTPDHPHAEFSIDIHGTLQFFASWIFF